MNGTFHWAHAREVAQAARDLGISEKTLRALSHRSEGCQCHSGGHDPLKANEGGRISVFQDAHIPMHLIALATRPPSQWMEAAMSELLALTV